MEKIRVGVVGVGHLGRLHVSLYSQIPGAELVGIYDIDQEKGDRIAHEFDTRSFSTLEGLLKEIDAVSVVVPTISHFQVASSLLNQGIHTFVEKPISSTVEEADQLINLAREKNLVLQVGHIERFNPALRALTEIELHPMFIESHRLAPFDPRGTDVAVVLDLMIHDVDIILNLVKSPIKKFDASGVAVVSDEADIANARIQFENGCVANVTASRISAKKLRRMRLFQKDAYISVDFLQGLSEVFRLEVESKSESSEKGYPTLMLGKIDQGKRKRRIVYEKLPASEGNPLRMELEAFLESIRKGSSPPVGGEEGRRALKVALDITKIINQQASNSL